MCDVFVTIDEIFVSERRKFMQDKGYVQIYTGNGKGKTTATIGLMIRAIGAGKKIYFSQFMKNGDYSEIKTLKERFPEITIYQYGIDGFILNRAASTKEKEQMTKGLEDTISVLKSCEYDLVILDEINVALFMDLVSIEKVEELINSKPENVELVLTGRYANQKIINMADLVTEMKEIKHYFNKGVQARKGIEM